jgi:hypothetical protein
MANLSSVVLYICQHHPSGYELSVERIISILYLVDWKYAIEFSSQMLNNVTWQIHDGQPCIDSYSIKELISLLAKIRLRTEQLMIQLSKEEKCIIDFVIKASSNKEENELNRLVYSTYPAITRTKEIKLNFPNLVQEYHKTIEKLSDFPDTI